LTASRRFEPLLPDRRENTPSRQGYFILGLLKGYAERKSGVLTADTVLNLCIEKITSDTMKRLRRTHGFSKN
jgi:hypothetical protein